MKPKAQDLVNLRPWAPFEPSVQIFFHKMEQKMHKHISSGQQPLFCSPDGSLNEAIYRNSTNLLYSDKQCIAMLLSNRLRNQFVNLYLS